MALNRMAEHAAIVQQIKGQLGTLPLVKEHVRRAVEKFLYDASISQGSPATLVSRRGGAVGMGRFDSDADARLCLAFVHDFLKWSGMDETRTSLLLECNVSACDLDTLALTGAAGLAARTNQPDDGGRHTSAAAGPPAPPGAPSPSPAASPPLKGGAKGPSGHSGGAGAPPLLFHLLRVSRQQGQGGGLAGNGSASGPTRSGRQGDWGAAVQGTGDSATGANNAVGVFVGGVSRLPNHPAPDPGSPSFAPSSHATSAAVSHTGSSATGALHPLPGWGASVAAAAAGAQLPPGPPSPVRVNAPLQLQIARPPDDRAQYPRAPTSPNPLQQQLLLRAPSAVNSQQPQQQGGSDTDAHTVGDASPYAGEEFEAEHETDRYHGMEHEADRHHGEGGDEAEHGVEAGRQEGRPAEQGEVTEAGQNALSAPGNNTHAGQETSTQGGSHRTGVQAPGARPALSRPPPSDSPPLPSTEPEEEAEESLYFASEADVEMTTDTFDETGGPWSSTADDATGAVASVQAALLRAQQATTQQAQWAQGGVARAQGAQPPVANWQQGAGAALASSGHPSLGVPPARTGSGAHGAPVGQQQLLQGQQLGLTRRPLGHIPEEEESAEASGSSAGDTGTASLIGTDSSSGGPPNGAAPATGAPPSGEGGTGTSRNTSAEPWGWVASPPIATIPAAGAPLRGAGTMGDVTETSANSYDPGASAVYSASAASGTSVAAVGEAVWCASGAGELLPTPESPALAPSSSAPGGRVGDGATSFPLTETGGKGANDGSGAAGVDGSLSGATSDCPVAAASGHIVDISAADDPDSWDREGRDAGQSPATPLPDGPGLPHHPTPLRGSRNSPPNEVPGAAGRPSSSSSTSRRSPATEASGSASSNGPPSRWSPSIDLGGPGSASYRGGSPTAEFAPTLVSPDTANTRVVFAASSSPSYDLPSVSPNGPLGGPGGVLGARGSPSGYGDSFRGSGSPTLPHTGASASSTLRRQRLHGAGFGGAAPVVLEGDLGSGGDSGSDSSFSPTLRVTTAEPQLPGPPATASVYGGGAIQLGATAPLRDARSRANPRSSHDDDDDEDATAAAGGVEAGGGGGGGGQLDAPAPLGSDRGGPPPPWGTGSAGTHHHTIEEDASGGTQMLRPITHPSAAGLSTSFSAGSMHASAAGGGSGGGLLSTSFSAGSTRSSRLGRGGRAPGGYSMTARRGLRPGFSSGGGGAVAPAADEQQPHPGAPGPGGAGAHAHSGDGGGDMAAEGGYPVAASARVDNDQASAVHPTVAHPSTATAAAAASAYSRSPSPSHWNDSGSEQDRSTAGATPELEGESELTHFPSSDADGCNGGDHPAERRDHPAERRDHFARDPGSDETGVVATVPGLPSFAKEISAYEHAEVTGVLSGDPSPKHALALPARGTSSLGAGSAPFSPSTSPAVVHTPLSSHAVDPVPASLERAENPPVASPDPEALPQPLQPQRHSGVPLLAPQQQPVDAQSPPMQEFQQKPQQQPEPAEAAPPSQSELDDALWRELLLGDEGEGSALGGEGEPGPLPSAAAAPAVAATATTAIASAAATVANSTASAVREGAPRDAADSLQEEGEGGWGLGPPGELGRTRSLVLAPRARVPQPGLQTPAPTSPPTTTGPLPHALSAAPPSLGHGSPHAPAPLRGASPTASPITGVADAFSAAADVAAGGSWEEREVADELRTPTPPRLLPLQEGGPDPAAAAGDSSPPHSAASSSSFGSSSGGGSVGSAGAPDTGTGRAGPSDPWARYDPATYSGSPRGGTRGGGAPGEGGRGSPFTAAPTPPPPSSSQPISPWLGDYPQQQQPAGILSPLNIGPGGRGSVPWDSRDRGAQPDFGSGDLPTNGAEPHAPAAALPLPSGPSTRWLMDDYAPDTRGSGRDEFDEEEEEEEGGGLGSGALPQRSGTPVSVAALQSQAGRAVSAMMQQQQWQQQQGQGGEEEGPRSGTPPGEHETVSWLSSDENHPTPSSAAAAPAAVGANGPQAHSPYLLSPLTPAAPVPSAPSGQGRGSYSARFRALDRALPPPTPPYDISLSAPRAAAPESPRSNDPAVSPSAKSNAGRTGGAGRADGAELVYAALGSERVQLPLGASALPRTPPPLPLVDGRGASGAVTVAKALWSPEGSAAAATGGTPPHIRPTSMGSGGGDGSGGISPGSTSPSSPSSYSHPDALRSSRGTRLSPALPSLLPSRTGGAASAVVWSRSGELGLGSAAVVSSSDTSPQCMRRPSGSSSERRPSSPGVPSESAIAGGGDAYAYAVKESAPRPASAPGTWGRTSPLGLANAAECMQGQQRQEFSPDEWAAPEMTPAADVGCTTEPAEGCSARTGGAGEPQGPVVGNEEGDDLLATMRSTLKRRASLSAGCPSPAPDPWAKGGKLLHVEASAPAAQSPDSAVRSAALADAAPERGVSRARSPPGDAPELRVAQRPDIATVIAPAYELDYRSGRDADESVEEVPWPEEHEDGAFDADLAF